MNDQLNDDGKKLEEKFNSLPEEIQDIIYSSATLEKVANIGEKYQLHIDKIEDLQFATEDVMSGDIRADEFISHIAKELEIDQETANKIGQEIDQQVFESVRDAIKSLSEPKEPETIPAPTETPPVETKMEVTPIPVSQAPTTETAAEVKPITTDVAITTDQPKELAKIPTEEVKPTIADIKTKEVTSSPTQTSNYKTDPYREPIE